MGQRVNIHNLTARLYVGIGYARLAEQFNIFSSSQGYYSAYMGKSYTHTATNNMQEQHNSKFSGIGPVIGLTGVYNLYGGLGIVANLETSLLLGKAKSSYKSKFATYLDNSKNYEGTPLQEIPEQREKRAMPKLAVSLGIQYSINYLLAIEVGYKAAMYMNSKDRIIKNAQRVSSSYSVDGPYAQSKLLTA